MKAIINGAVLSGSPLMDEYLDIESNNALPNRVITEEIMNVTTSYLSNTVISVNDWEEDSTYEDFGYKADIAVTNITSEYFADIVFNPVDAMSGIFAPIAETLNTGHIRIYANEIPDNDITIPTIKLVKAVSL